MQHPLQWIPEEMQWSVLLILIALFLVFGKMARVRKTSAARPGILSLEFTGNKQRANEIIALWGERGVRRAVSAVRWDFLFLLAYSTLFGLLCVWAADGIWARYTGLGASIGVALAWNQWLAGLCDAVENVALLKVLREPEVKECWPPVAYWFAASKFTLIIAGLLYLAISLLVWLV